MREMEKMEMDGWRWIYPLRPSPPRALPTFTADAALVAAFATVSVLGGLALPSWGGRRIFWEKLEKLSFWWGDERCTIEAKPEEAILGINRGGEGGGRPCLGSSEDVRRGRDRGTSTCRCAVSPN